MSAWGIVECITNVRCDYYCFSASRSSTNVGFYSLSIVRSGLGVAVYMYICCVKLNGMYVHAGVWCVRVCMRTCATSDGGGIERGQREC